MKHKQMDKSIHDGEASSLSPECSLQHLHTNTQTARKYVQDTKNKVNAFFDKMTTTSSTGALVLL